MRSLQELSTLFNEVRWKPNRNGFKCLCPCHPDKKPSLDVDHKNDRILFLCRAGCETSDVLRAVGLEWSDIMPDSPKPNAKPLFRDWYKLNRKFPVSEIYDYTDADGKVLYSNIKFQQPDGKTFRQYILNADRTDVIRDQNGKRIWDARGRKSLYNLPELLRAIQNGETVYVVEGEKDCETLRKIGLVATTSGSAKSWSNSFSKYFDGADVVLLPDNDAPGAEYADMVQLGILSTVKSLKRITVSTLEKGDVTDYLTKEDGSKEKLLQMVTSAPNLKESPAASVKDSDTHYLEDFYEYDRFGKAIKTIDPRIVRWICDNYTFFVLGDLPYFMNSFGCYKMDDGGVRMKRIIQSCIIPRLCKDGTINAIYRMVLYQDRRKAYEELNQYPVEYVPFRNGFYDPLTNRMLPIKPEHFVINQIPHDYDPAAIPPCPTFDGLLKFQLPNEDERELWLEYGGTCFTRDTSGQRFMIVKGNGGTGKSTQLNVLIDCVGTDNISNETLQGLMERFGATILFGKLANICADISSEDMKRTDVLKKVTGEDRNGVKFEKKGKDSFFFTPFCKLLFSANEIPLNRDEKSNAFYRRLLITVIDRKPEKADRNLHRKLHGELDGIIHRYMDSLRKYYARGGYFIESQRSKEEVARLRRSADSVIAFFDERIIRDTHGRIERSQLFSEYESYCEEEDRRYPVTRNRLFERFRDMGIPESKVNGVRYFIGIRLQDIVDGDYVEVDDNENPFT